MNELSDNILKKLQAQGVTPKPRWHFLLTRSVFWTLAVVSVLIGSMAFAVGIFVFIDNSEVSPAAMEQSQIADVAQNIPFIWLGVLTLFTLSAYFGFRNTRSGYRYATAKVILSVILASILLGLILDEFDFGQRTHEFLLSHTHFYDSIIHSRNDLEK